MNDVDEDGMMMMLMMTIIRSMIKVAGHDDGGDDDGDDEDEVNENIDENDEINVSERCLFKINLLYMILLHTIYNYFFAIRPAHTQGNLRCSKPHHCQD